MSPVSTVPARTHALPRFVVAAPSTGQGKTTVATGLMAALTRAGHVVSGHKIGPDYIDPGYHALACGRPGRNLDPHLVGEDLVVPLLLNGARGADVAVVEGVMGLYDGRVGHDGFSSTAHVAGLITSPVVLVVDISRSSRSIGAVVHGMATFPDHGRGAPVIAGVILNQVGSPRQAAEVASSIDLPVLGVLPRDESFATPSRHLGLVPAGERAEAAHALDRLAEVVAEHVDLEAVLAVARTAPDLGAEPWDARVALGLDVGPGGPARPPQTGLDVGPGGSARPPQTGLDVGPGGPARPPQTGLDVGPGGPARPPQTERPVVAVAGGRAFTFRYPETEELLRAAGCEVVTFDPTTDPHLPPGTAGIYLGGGFPEVHAADLAGNAPILAELKGAIGAGVPTVAECAGLLYLAHTLDGTPMVDAIEVAAEMTPRLTLRYPTVTAAADSLLGRTGETVTGHEFHRTATTPAAGPVPAWTIDGTDVGFAGPTLHASYLHTHWAGHPQLARRFADAVHAATPYVVPEPAVRPAPTPAPPVVVVPDAVLEDPLRHHGDVEAAGMLDFAVNVFPGSPPPWLRDALHAGLDAAGAYPDPTLAEAAIAARHDRPAEEVLATAGAAEAFGLLARLSAWSMPAVVHPQFTEPQVALEEAHLDVVEVGTDADFRLDPTAVPEEADLVFVGNPTNPTGVLHPKETILALLRPGRLVVVDEAFMDAVPGETESLAGHRHEGLVVIRSLTKHWGIPGVRAGYLLGHPAVVRDCRLGQTPWSVSSTALAALVACTGPDATHDSPDRAATLSAWREHLEQGLDALGVRRVASRAGFVLAEVGDEVHAHLRAAGIAVRRADTFPGLGPAWVRIAARPPELTDVLLAALDTALTTSRQTSQQTSLLENR